MTVAEEGLPCGRVTCAAQPVADGRQAGQAVVHAPEGCVGEIGPRLQGLFLRLPGNSPGGESSGRHLVSQQRL